MATEQLVELFALDGPKGTSDVTPRTAGKSKKETKIPYNIENPQSWDIEELWNQSQVIGHYNRQLCYNRFLILLNCFHS